MIDSRPRRTEKAAVRLPRTSTVRRKAQTKVKCRSGRLEKANRQQAVPLPLAPTEPEIM